ncbi:Ribosomal protein S12 methylthiotransferase RimO [Rubripirellula tenax]|uniref:Ribosomal protein S12 methylthiotransferase RimO n=2 Tax=Rubripirellula tenax TaxID=2528015 RepID=A0A5C6EFP6_9BACT|nr:Ribosomal protein S12 methylthiotransferase RimO [Rubripirellula tenax]
MSGLRVVDPDLLRRGLSFPGLRKRANAIASLPPLGLLTLAATVGDGWDVSLVQDDGGLPLDQTLEQIMATNPDVVAFSSLTPAVNRAALLSNRLRSRSVTTVIGGLHATAAPETCVDHFDAVAVGDGERIFPKLLSDWREGRLKQFVRADEPIAMTESPVPDWSLLGDATPPRYAMQTMRGCPWACSFCAASRMLGPPRTKSDRQIELEVEAITANHMRPWIELADDNTFASDRDHGPMLESLRRARAKWFTESDWRIADRPELLKAIARSGCRQILIGLESTVFRYPGMGRKTAGFQRMVDAALAIQEAGIVVNACFIVGADGETRQSIERLGDFLETAPFGEVQLTLQTPFPGTSMYRSLRQSGRLLEGDFSRYTLFDVVYHPDLMTADELRSAFADVISQVFRPAMHARRSKIIQSVRSFVRKLT